MVKKIFTTKINNTSNVNKCDNSCIEFIRLLVNKRERKANKIKIK